MNYAADFETFLLCDNFWKSSFYKTRVTMWRTWVFETWVPLKEKKKKKQEQQQQTHDSHHGKWPHNKNDSKPVM